MRGLDEEPMWIQAAAAIGAVAFLLYGLRGAWMLLLEVLGRN